MPFQNIDEIEEHFKQRLAAVPDDDEGAVQQIQFERDRTKFEFERAQWQAEQHAHNRQNWVEEAIRKHPQLKGLEDYIKGETAEEIKKSALRLADKMGGPKADPVKEAYGPSTGVVGQPIAVPTANDDARDRVYHINREIQQGLRLKESDAKFFVAAVGGHAIGNIRRALRHGAAGRG